MKPDSPGASLHGLDLLIQYWAGSDVHQCLTYHDFLNFILPNDNA